MSVDGPKTTSVVGSMCLQMFPALSFCYQLAAAAIGSVIAFIELSMKGAPDGADRHLWD